MPYILLGTKDLMAYRHTLGRPCMRKDMANAIGVPIINFEGIGRDKVSFTAKYGEAQAQALAAVLGVQVSDVTTNGGQILI